MTIHDKIVPDASMVLGDVTKSPERWEVVGLPGTYFRTQAEAVAASKVVKLRSALIDTFGDVTIGRFAELIITNPERGRRLKEIIDRVFA